MSDNPLSQLLKRLERHGRLAAEERSALLALPYKLQRYNPGGYAVREGEVASSCGILLSGYAYRQKTTSDGKRQILSLHIPGEALDFQNIFLDVADHNVQALTRATLALVPRRAFVELARSYPAIAHAMLIETLLEAAIFREWIVNVGQRDARTRLAHVLCELAVRLDAHGLAEKTGYELPMTQSELADVVGLTSVHVNRVLKGLEAEGLVQRNRREVRFPDWHALVEVADFNDRYLHVAV